MKPYRKQFIIGPIFKLIEAILELLIPTLMVYVIDIGVKHHDQIYVLKMGGVMLLIAAVGLLSAYVCQYEASIASQGFGTLVRNAMYRHIESLSHAELDRFGVSSLVNRITNDVNVMQQAVAMFIRLIIRTPFICIGSLVMSMLLDLKLSVIIMLTMPIFAVILYFVMSHSIPLYKTVQKKMDSLALILRENLSGVRVIRAFARTGHEKEKFDGANDDYTAMAVRAGKISAILNPATVVILNFAAIAIIWFGGIRVSQGQMTQGEIVAFINYISYIIQALIMLANLIILFTRASASSARVAEVFETESSVKNNESEKHEESDSCFAAEFKNVSFKYNQDSETALRNINFKLRKGETLGIIGGTGSGKTTLVNLIPRFYDVTGGAVFVNGKDVRSYKIQDLRRKIGTVLQKAVLFTGTVSENIRQARKDASGDEVKKAAETAQASEFIEKMPKGYDTLITRGGSNLSGGQKQRLNIARALLQNPEVLILDDSSSALDYMTDLKLRSALKNSTRQMSVIIVSQRVSSVQDADSILVLDDGEQVGYGTHEKLLESCEVYREICSSQLSSEEAQRA